MSDPVASVSLALNSTEGASARQQWIHLLPPPGAVRGRDGRQWVLGDLAQVIRATNSYADGRGVPVDYEHQSEYAPDNGQPAPASGWIKELQTRDDGLWGRVEWTAKAANHVLNKEYRFISPVFSYTKGQPGRIVRLVSAALTNGPNLNLKALNRSTNGATTMDEMDELRGVLGLAEEAGVGDVISAVRTLLAGAAASNRPDPAKFVPMELFERTVSELHSRNQGMSDELALNHVDENIRTGRLLPYLREWSVALCKNDRPAFDAFILKTGATLQNVMKPAGGNISGKPPAAVSRLSDVDAQVARNLGHSEEEFIAANRSRMS